MHLKELSEMEGALKTDQPESLHNNLGGGPGGRVGAGRIQILQSKMCDSESRIAKKNSEPIVHHQSWI